MVVGGEEKDWGYDFMKGKMVKAPGGIEASSDEVIPFDFIHAIDETTWSYFYCEKQAHTVPVG